MAAEDKPLSIAESAVALHELFLSPVKAGFTEQQALYLQILGQRPPQPGS